MKKEKDSLWYNEMYLRKENCHSPYNIIYDKIWGTLMSLIPSGSNIIELGCGTGQLAYKLKKHRYNYRRGYDFSSVAIDMAKKLSDANFICKKITPNNAKSITKDCDIVIMTEFLEHINNDLELIKNIDKTIIATVPDFDFQSHVRFFPDKEDVNNRYSCNCDKIDNYYIFKKGK